MLHYILCAPNTKGGLSWGMEILSEDRQHGPFRIAFSTAQPPNPALEAAGDSDSLSVYESARNVVHDQKGAVHQVLGIGGEVFYRKRVVGSVQWERIFQLSNGNGASCAPLITISGPSLLVVWQNRSTWEGHYLIPFRQSMDGGVDLVGFCFPG